MLALQAEAPKKTACRFRRHSALQHSALNRGIHASLSRAAQETKKKAVLF
jgi:hypothetical protein